MKIVIHDWNDEEASGILQAIQRSASLDAKLVLAEILVPEDGKPNWSLFVDLLMLGEPSGKERTRTEFGDLLAEGWFQARPCNRCGVKHLPVGSGCRLNDDHQRWLGESVQCDKWIFCLSAARIAADQERTCRDEPDGTTVLRSRRK